MKALIIIDVQKDFLSQGSLAIKGAEEVIPFINSIMDQYELVVGSIDWHPIDHYSFQAKWPVHCVKDTEGAELADELDEGKIKKIFKKGLEKNSHGYSAFDSELADYLWGKGIEEIDLVGLATDFCVKATAIDGKKHGFKVSVHRQGVRAIGDNNKAIRDLEKSGVKIIN